MELPSTWQWVRVGEICEINPRLPEKLELNDDIKVTFLPMAAVDELFGEILRAEERLYGEVKKGFTPFIENDVLLAKITPSMENGKAAVAHGLINGIGLGSTEFHVIRCSELILPEYLYFYIRQPTFRKWAKSSFIGSAGQQRVPADFLARVVLPLPPRIEQQRVVDILKQVIELRRIRRENSLLISSINQEVFTHFFGNHGDLEKEKFQLGRITQFITSGSRDWSKYYSDSSEDAIFIRVQNIKRGKLDLSDIAYVSAPANAESERARVQPFDILISITGTIGLVAVVPEDIGEAYISQHVALVRTDKSIPVGFIAEYLNHQAGGQLQISRANYGQTKPGLNLQQITKLSIPVVDRKELYEFVNALKEIESLMDSALSAEAVLDDIQENISHEAFSGRLTVKWRQENQRFLQEDIQKSNDMKGRLRELLRNKVTITESAPEEREIIKLEHRHWLFEHLSEIQLGVLQAIRREWRGTLIPSEDLDEFIERCFQVEHLDNAHDQIKRSLNQLAGLGLIAKISIPNQAGEYVTGYRGLRDDELSKISDSNSLSSSFSSERGAIVIGQD